MKEFIKQMMSEESDVSSKRVNGSICLGFLFFYLTWFFVISAFASPERVASFTASFWPVCGVLLGLIGGFFGLTQIDKFIK